MPDTSVSPSMLLVPFSCHPSAGAQREWVWVGESMYGLFKRNCLGLQEFLPPTQNALVFATRSCGNVSSWHWNSGHCWCGVGIPPSQDIPSEFVSTAHGWAASPFCVCTPPTSLDGCAFFNSVAARFPFNLTSEWLLVLAVILVQLCEGVSPVCLCHHLDRNCI